MVPTPWSSLEGISQPPLLERLYRHFPWRSLIAVLAILLAALIAVSEVGNWNLVLRFFYQASYGKNDPLFGNDFSFYLFSLPALTAFKNWLLSVLVLSALCATGIYWAHGEIVLDSRRRWIAPMVIAHASVLLGLFFIVEASAFWLERFQLLFGDNGIVVGAGYTDVHVELPILWGLIVLCLAGAIASFVNVRAPSFRIPVVSVAAVFGFAVLISSVVHSSIRTCLRQAE